MSSSSIILCCGLHKFFNSSACSHFTLKKNDEIVRKYLKDDKMPYLGELVKETSLTFVNTHHSFEGSRPIAPTIVEIGGIHIKDAQPLDPDIKAVLDSAKDGVIYVSWGSMIRFDSLPVEKRNSLLKAFGSFKQTILWKWENDTIADQPKNVFIRKWMPQRDILCSCCVMFCHFQLYFDSFTYKFLGHPNVRVFMG